MNAPWRSIAERLAGTMLLGLVLPLAGCIRQRGASSEPPVVLPDSLIGVVAVTGTSFEEQLMLRVGDRWSRLRSGPSDSAALTRLSGVEIVARGVNDANGFRVRSFTVNRVDGQPVLDGIVRRDGASWFLETAKGRVLLGNAPAPLRSMVGARVWIGGPLDTGPNNYGIITPAR